jgi:molybdopterin converting factor subunit 1
MMFFSGCIVKQVRSRILLRMRVKVLYFGVLKESLGRVSEEVELAEGARVADLMARYENESSEWMRSIAVAVNREYARGEDVLRDGDEVALLPPVSGGSNWSVEKRVSSLRAARFGRNDNGSLAGGAR